MERGGLGINQGVREHLSGFYCLSIDSREGAKRALVLVPLPKQMLDKRAKGILLSVVGNVTIHTCLVHVIHRS